ncbi:MAG: hypothetical protein AAB654_26130 [Acidobacteriota bacterium]|mgnify:CR=1 FL=1
MRRRKHVTRRANRAQNRRTTLTLPDALLREAERLARNRRQTLSSAVAALLEHGLKSNDQAAGRPARVLEMWKKAFAPLTDEEMLLVDGVMLEEPAAAAE